MSSERNPHFACVLVSAGLRTMSYHMDRLQSRKTIHDAMYSAYTLLAPNTEYKFCYVIFPLGYDIGHMSFVRKSHIQHGMYIGQQVEFGTDHIAKAAIDYAIEQGYKMYHNCPIGQLTGDSLTLDEAIKDYCG